MFEIRKSFRFEAAHKLGHHQGKCRRLHGHSFRGTVFLRNELLIESGSETNMVTDFGAVGQAVNAMTAAHLDHHYLNETLGEESPTAEFIARWCFDYLSRDHQFGSLIVAVEIEETCTAAAIYRRA